MNKFKYLQPKTLPEASSLLFENPGNAVPYAGGTDTLDLIKHDIVNPQYVINLKLIPDLDRIKFSKNKALTIGACVKVAELIENNNIKNYYPILYQAAKNIASPQLRNMGTVGGNICQRPRCWYFREDFECLRKDGGECFAYLGENKYHCIIGGGPCYIVHPSDLAVVFTALNAQVVIFSKAGERTVPIKEFFVLPDTNYLKENILQPGEIIKEINVPVFTSDVNSGYVKFKERATWDFAVVSVGAVIQFEANRIKSANIAFGGVAPVPWVDEDFNDMLRGSIVNEQSVDAAVKKMLSNAEPLEKNGYKIPLVRNLTKRLILDLTT